MPHLTTKKILVRSNNNDFNSLDVKSISSNESELTVVVRDYSVLLDTPIKKSPLPVINNIAKCNEPFEINVLVRGRYVQTFYKCEFKCCKCEPIKIDVIDTVRLMVITFTFKNTTYRTQEEYQDGIHGTVLDKRIHL